MTDSRSAASDLIYTVFSDRSIWKLRANAVLSQRAHDGYATSAQRRCNIITLHRRWGDVLITSCACYDKYQHLVSEPSLDFARYLAITMRTANTEIRMSGKESWPDVLLFAYFIRHIISSWGLSGVRYPLESPSEGRYRPTSTALVRFPGSLP